MRLRHLLLALPGLLAPSAATAQSLSARLDSAMRVAERDGFAGVVRVQRGEEVLLSRGYGMANRAARIPFTTATVVQIGSNTKDFTAVAMLQLQERGRLSLRDSLGKHFPAAPADKRGITLQQLMDHRAGFPLWLGGDFEPVGRQALVDSAMRVQLLFAPGSRQSYSNPGFSLLAAVIEQVTGKTYDEYVRDEILAPLGLHRTGVLLPGFAERELAHGYLPDGSDQGTMLAKPHASDGPYWNLRGNGGMLSTVDDMHSFYRALFESDRLLKPATRNLRFNPDEPVGLAGSDGVHFFLYERFPRMKTEIIIASSDARVKAPMIRRALGRVLGLPDPEQGDEAIATRPGGRAPVPAMAAVLTGLVSALDSGDAATLRAFISAHFAIDDADAPSVDERVTRLSGLHARLGALKIVRMESYAQGPAELGLVADNEDRVTLKVLIDAEAPHRIHSVQALLGGG